MSLARLSGGIGGIALLSALVAACGEASPDGGDGDSGGPNGDGDEATSGGSGGTGAPGVGGSVDGGGGSGVGGSGSGGLSNTGGQAGTGGGGYEVIDCPETFQNPIIWEDLPDLEVIRVGDAYYYTASTFHHSPGAPLLRSYDLVNWEYISHSVPVLDVHPMFDLDGDSGYHNGIWASTLGYREPPFR